MTFGRQLTILLKSSKIMFYPQREKIMKKRQISKRKKKMAITTPTPTPTPTLTPTPTTTAMTTAPNWLPDEIIFFHILPKLPVRCLLRFTCVSKLWHTTIHHPNFIASHFSHAKSNTSLVAICVKYRTQYLNFLHLEKKEEEEEEKGGEHHHPIYNNNASVDLLLANLFVVGSCNGLTCSILSTTMQITNPSTRELLIIRRAKKSKAARTICLGGSCNGFGFDPLMNEYKILQNYFDCSGYYECWVYTLGSNLWRDITTTCNNYLASCVPIEMKPICISGALFWRTSQNRGILSFDLHHEEFHFIPCPQVPQGSVCYSLFEMEGRPCLVYSHDNLIKDGVQLTLYTLKDHHHHLNGRHTQQQQQQHTASSCSGSWIRLGYAIRIPKRLDTRSIQFVAFYKQIYLQWVTRDGEFVLCNVNRLGILNECSVMYKYRLVELVNHVENLLCLKTFVPPSADEDELRYVSSREAIHESPTTSTSCCSKDRQRRESKRYRLLTHGCFTTPCWVSLEHSELIEGQMKNTAVSAEVLQMGRSGYQKYSVAPQPPTASTAKRPIGLHLKTNNSLQY